MSLRMILGNSGCGKTRWMMDELLQRAQDEPDQMFYMVVPEQFTMQTQREFVERHSGHCIMNIDVVSFERLAYRIFDELGISDFIVLEETGKNLILRRLAGQKESDLQVLRGNIHRMGYISEIKSMISEFSQYDISVEQLTQIVSRLDENSSLARKMQDLLMLYEEFDRYLEKGCITAERVLEILVQRAADSELLRGCVMAFDGFTGFTPIQMKLMRVLFHCVSDVYVTVTIDEDADPYVDQGMHDLFYMSKKMIRGLTKIASQEGIPIAQPQIVSLKEVALRSDHSHDRVNELAFLERNLFRTRKQLFQGPITEDALNLCALQNPQEELLYVAAQIRELVMSGAYRYRDIAIVSGDMQTYENYAPSIFSRMDIPYFVDRKKPLLFHPFIEWVRAVLEMQEDDFSYESVFRYLRSGLGGFAKEEVDLLENHVLAYGIRGRKQWQERWIVTEDGQMQTLDVLRQKLVDQMSSVSEVFHKKDATVREQTECLYRLMVQLNMQQQMQEWELFFREKQDETSAKEYAQIYEYVIDLLDQVVELLGDEVIPVSEYAQLLDAGFSAAKIGVIPPGNDYVLLGDIERTRLNHIKVMFVVGVNDGVIPKGTDRGSILSPYDREVLAELDVELAPNQREQVFIQKFYLYLNLTKASQKLYLTWSNLDGEGKIKRPSYLVANIQAMYPKLEIQEPKEQKMYTPQQSMYIYAQKLQKAAESLKAAEAFDGEDTKIEDAKTVAPNLADGWMALYRWYQEQDKYKAFSDRLLERAFDVFAGETLDQETAAYLYGRILSNSVTRLEQYERCAFAHFLKYGLRLEERKILELGAVDLGSVFHDTLDFYAQLLEQQQCTWTDVTEEKQQELLEQSMAEAVLKLGKSAFFDNPRNEYVLERVRRIVKRSVWALTKQLKRGTFHPDSYEILFQREEKLDLDKLWFDKSERMFLKGRIDRIDICEKDHKIYAKIIDYKSGKKTFQLLNMYYGLQLQLIVYMNAAIASLANKYPGKEIEPAGIFYYHIDDPIVTEEEGNEPEDIEEALLTQLKMNGLVNSNPEVYGEMDEGLQCGAGYASHVIPVALKKDGNPTASSKTVTKQQFFDMADYVSQLITQAGTSILQGDIQINPYRLKDDTGCDYCPYRGVCGFDVKQKEYAFRDLDDMKEEELWQLIGAKNKDK